MIEQKQVERLAGALQRAWAIRYGVGSGPQDGADAFLKWLEVFRLDPALPLCRELAETCCRGEGPHAVSACGEKAAMRWFLREEFMFGCDANHSIYLVPAAELARAPKVAGDPGDAPSKSSSYERLI